MSIDLEQFRKDLLRDAWKAASDVIKEGPPVIETTADRPSYAETNELALRRARVIYGPNASIEGLNDAELLELASEQARRQAQAAQQRVDEAQAATPEGIAAIAEQKRQQEAEQASLVADVRKAHDLPEDFSDDEVLGIWNTIQTHAEEKANDTVEANIAAAEAASKGDV